jgi:TM2 domain-containing membrane protein YozV
MHDGPESETYTRLRRDELSRLSASHPTPSASQRVPAGVLALLLGCLGVHKFMLGYRGAGLTMLLVSVLSIGFAAPVVAVIGIIEGIVYLTRTDADFVSIYQKGERHWF